MAHNRAVTYLTRRLAQKAEAVAATEAADMAPNAEAGLVREQQGAQLRQADTEVPADLRRKVDRGSRNLRLLVALEVLVTVVPGGGATLLAVMDPRAEMVILAAAVWVFPGAAWAFAMTNRRGSWAPVTVSTAEFVNLSIRRCRNNLASAGFGAGLYFAEMAFCLTWIYWDPERRGPLPAIVFSVATPIFLAGLMRYRRKKRSELEGLVELQRQLS